MYSATSTVEAILGETLRYLKPLGLLTVQQKSKKRFLLYTERSVWSDHVCKNMKRQPVADMYHQTQFFCGFCNMVSFEKTDLVMAKKDITQKAVAFDWENLYLKI